VRRLRRKKNVIDIKFSINCPGVIIIMVTVTAMLVRLLLFMLSVSVRNNIGPRMVPSGTLLITWDKDELDVM